MLIESPIRRPLDERKTATNVELISAKPAPKSSLTETRVGVADQSHRPVARVVAAHEKPKVAADAARKTTPARAMKPPIDRCQTRGFAHLIRPEPRSGDRWSTHGNIAPPGPRVVRESLVKGRSREAMAATVSVRFSTDRHALPAITWVDPAARGRSTRTSKS